MAEQLPQETYKAYHKYNAPRMEEDEEGKPVLRFGYLGTHDCNHARRMKRLFKKEGIPGLENYLRQRNFSLFPQPIQETAPLAES